MRWRPLPLLLLAGAPAAQEDPVHTNRLIDETSPYLRQHAHNPVDWYPWGPEALKKAKEEDKPIFLSIGYAACHWCHVMERESFEDEEIAEVMNENFVCIKVDREERPDLDEIYMRAVQGMTGQGGWPMSVWMTPDLEPFYGGTYFPPEDRGPMPGFERVCEHWANLWKEKREQIESTAGKVGEHLQESLAADMSEGALNAGLLDGLVARSRERFDAGHGGFGEPPAFAPKFPHAGELSMLLRAHARTGEEQALAMVEQTLRAMARGGMYDQLGGGFHRYSTDREWLVPHFEKMLYDNALLARTYTEAWVVTRDPEYERVVRETLAYLLREMQHRRGGFYSSQDADSEGVEGKFFVWTMAEVEEVLGEDAKAAALRWGITPEGNWEHANVLHRARTVEEVAGELGVDPAEAGETLERCREKLLARREQRVHPGTDDKVLTAWNGLAIAALAEAHQVFGEERWLEAARRAADFCLTTMRREGRLLRTWRDLGDDPRAKLDGYLEDYAFLADGLLCLFEADFDPRWLRASEELLGVVREHFRAEDGALYFTADDHEELIARSTNVMESSTPSGTALAAMSFLRLGLLKGDPEVEEVGVRALEAHTRVLDRYPFAAPTLVMAAQLHLGDPREVVIAGPPGQEATGALLRSARLAFPPHHVTLLVHGGNRAALAELTGIVTGKEPVGEAPAAYVCRRGVCKAPVTDPEAMDLGGR